MSLPWDDPESDPMADVREHADRLRAMPAIDAYVRRRLQGRPLLIVGQAPRHAEGDRARPDREEPFYSATGDRIARAVWGERWDRAAVVARTDRINLNPALLRRTDDSRWDPFHRGAAAVVAGRILAVLDDRAGRGHAVPRAIIACGRGTCAAMGVPFRDHGQVFLGADVPVLTTGVLHPGGTNIMLNDPVVRAENDELIRAAFEVAGLA